MNALLLLWTFRRWLPLAAAVLLILPVTVILLMGAAIAVVPLASREQVQTYQEAAESQPVPVNPTMLIAIDAVRYRQDWSQVTEEGIQELAALYIEEINDPGGEPCAEGSPHCRCQVTGEGWVCLTEPYSGYDRRSDEDVMNLLGFSDDEKQQALFMGTAE